METIVKLLLSRWLLSLYFLFGLLGIVTAQKIELRIHQISFDGIHYKASLFAIPSSGYVPGNDLTGNWIAMNIRLDVMKAVFDNPPFTPPAASVTSVVITNSNLAQISSANIALTSPGSVIPPNSSQLSINILRDTDFTDDLPITSTGVELFQFEITFDYRVQSSNLVYVRPYVNANDPNGSFWTNPSTAVIRRPIDLFSPVTLPVKLFSFDVEKEGGTASISWVTTEEINADRFEIERSGDGKIWNLLGSKMAKSESSSLVGYNFIDYSPIRLENLYRLKMIDHDGTFAYSKIKILSFDDFPSFKIYPNPVSDELTIQTYFGDRIEEIMFYNQSGILAYRLKYSKEQKVNIRHLPVGLYIMRINLEGGSTVHQEVVINR